MEWAYLTQRWDNGETTSHWFASPTGQDDWLEFRDPPPPSAVREIKDYLTNGKDGFLPMRAARSYLLGAATGEGCSIVFFTEYPKSYLDDRLRAK